MSLRFSVAQVQIGWRQPPCWAAVGRARGRSVIRRLHKTRDIGDFELDFGRGPGIWTRGLTVPNRRGVVSFCIPAAPPVSSCTWFAAPSCPCVSSCFLAVPGVCDTAVTRGRRKSQPSDAVGTCSADRLTDRSCLSSRRSCMKRSTRMTRPADT